MLQSPPTTGCTERYFVYWDAANSGSLLIFEMQMGEGQKKKKMTRAQLKFCFKTDFFFFVVFCAAQLQKLEKWILWFLLKRMRMGEQVPALQLELVFSTLRQEVAALGFVNRRA